MRRLHYFTWRQRTGVALLLVMFIAFASLVLLTTLFSSLAPRRASVSGEAKSDRALALADGMIDRLMGQINTTGLTYSVAAQDTAQAATKALVRKLLLDINGGLSTDTYETVVGNTRRYFYDLQTDTYFVLKTDGDPIATGTLTNLSTNVDVTGGLQGLDAGYATDNRWFELDANATYWYDANKPDTWQITVTAYNLSSPDIKRTLRAEAKREDINANTTTTANGNWYIPSTSTTNYFSDYSGLYHSRVNFGQFEVVTGYVRSDSDLWMGGWAKDIASAHGSVNDMAIDDNNRNDGRFGTNAVSLSTAKSQGLAVDGVPAAKWPNGTAALGTLSTNTIDPVTHLATVYHVTGNATIVFSVDTNGVGWVTINGTKRAMPPVTLDANGIATAGGSIYVSGDATVSGTLKGQVTIGAGDDVFIGGDILYTTPPRTDRNATPVDPSLQDKLGLIANSDIIIPPSTYNANKTLEVDAAMLAVNGYFGLDVNGSYNWHDIDSTPHWVGIWNGSQSVYGSGSAPAISSGNSVKGYEEQHTNYDWNLFNGARPPFFPAADDVHTPTTTYVDYAGSDLAALQALTQAQLTPVTSTSNATAYAQGMRFSKVLGGVTYYCRDATSWNTSYGATIAALDRLYRVSWKEEIAQPVGGN
jgi:hypothetical protein